MTTLSDGFDVMPDGETFVLHLAVAALLYRVALSLTSCPWTAGATALVFGLGAGVTDTLVWVAGQELAGPLLQCA